jgi:hypothetical protein
VLKVRGTWLRLGGSFRTIQKVFRRFWRQSEALGGRVAMKNETKNETKGKDLI